MTSPSTANSESGLANLLLPIVLLGRFLIGIITHIGSLAKLAGTTIFFIGVSKPRPKLVIEQIFSIGFTSQILVIITGTFTGAVMAAQMYFAFKGYGLGTTVGAMVSITVCRELAPVLAALMISGRAGTVITAQIANMKTNQQIDALHCMGVNPIEYLVAPRLIAMLVSAPILTAIATACGLLASHFMAACVFQIPAEWYRYHAWVNTDISDFFVGSVKSIFFGAVIVFVACNLGLKSDRGSDGVGRAIKNSVVLASIWIVVTNLFLSLALNYFFPLELQAF